MASRHEQIGQSAGDQQTVGVLVEPAIAHLGEAEHPLDDPDRMFDPGPDLRLGPIFRPLNLIHDTAVAVAAIGTTGCPSWSDASRDHAPSWRSWSKKAR